MAKGDAKQVGNCISNGTNELRSYNNYFYKYSDLGEVTIALPRKK